MQVRTDIAEAAADMTEAVTGTRPAAPMATTAPMAPMAPMAPTAGRPRP